MRNITTEMQEYLSGEGPTLATMIVVTATDNTVVRSTDYSDSINYLGSIFDPSTGMGRTAIQFNSNFTDDNLGASAFVGVFATYEELAGGMYDYAAISVFLLNPHDHSMGTINLIQGTFGGISLMDDVFSTEISSKIALMNSRVGDACSPTCRARLGDAKCGIDLGPITTSGSILSFSGISMFVSLVNSTLIFPHGVLTWTSGNNNGASFEVKSYSLGYLTLYVQPEFDFTDGDTFTIVQGCDKIYDTCKDTYSNAVNFRGEPNIPGADKYLTLIKPRDSEVDYL